MFTVSRSGRRVESVEYVDPANGAQYAVPQVTRNIHAGLTVIEEYNVTTNGVGGGLNERQRDFVWGDQYPEPVAMIDRTSDGAVGAGTDEVFHYLRGDLGGVVGLTNADGVLVERYTYDPYGQTYIEKPDGQGVAFEASSLGNPWMWTGQRYDAGVKLYHFLFRGYSPHLGRWLQRDPIGYIDGPNLYQYVMSNPLAWTDPLGLSFWAWAPALMLGVPAGEPPDAGFFSSASPFGATLFFVPGSALPGAVGGAVGAAVLAWTDKGSFSWGGFGGAIAVGAAAGKVGGVVLAPFAVPATAAGGAAGGAIGYTLKSIAGFAVDIGYYLGSAAWEEMKQTDRLRNAKLWVPPPAWTHEMNVPPC